MTPNIDNTIKIRHDIKIEVVKQANAIKTAKAPAKQKTIPDIAVKMHNIMGIDKIPTVANPQIPIIQLKIRQRKVNIEQT